MLLLKESCKVFREIVDFFASRDERADQARERLEKKPNDSAKGKIRAAFYAKISVDLATLDEILQGVPDMWPDDQGSETLAVCQVLQVLEDEFLRKEELVKDDDSEDEEGSISRADEPLSPVGEDPTIPLLRLTNFNRKAASSCF